jgi:DNA-binding LacI/PurR family transcriptional regulator
LTTIAHPVAHEAAFAASQLLDRLQKPDDARAAGSHLLPTALVDRITT